MQHRRHGRETADHQRGKGVLTEFWLRRGYDCFGEENNVDVLAVRISDGKRRIVTSEYERSTRNVVRNCRRNLCGGATVVLVVVPNHQLAAAVRRKLRREFSRAEWVRVAVVLLPALFRFINTSTTTTP